MPYAPALFIALLAVGFTEWSTDEDMVTMLTLVVTSALLAWWKPRRFVLSGLALGLVVPAIAVFSQITGIHPRYESAAEAASHGPRYAASLLILIVPALVAAFVGRFVANNMRVARDRSSHG